MVTYLSLLIKIIFHHHRKLVIAVVFPLLLIGVIFPFVSKTVENSQIPIGWVDQQPNEFTNIIKERFGEHPRIRLLSLERHELEAAVIKGEVEGGFLFHETFEESIRAGKIRNQITWVRTPQSILDSFAKERLAAEVMRISLNSEAANFVVNHKRDNEWDTYFAYSDQFWEPEPLFQIDIQPFENQSNMVENSQQSLTKPMLVLYGFWLWYAWVMFAILFMPLRTWRENGLVTRLKVTGGSVGGLYFIYFLLAALFVLLLFFLVTTVSTKFLFHSPYSLDDVLLIGSTLLLWTGMISFAALFLFKKRGYIGFVSLYSLSSFVLSLLLIAGMELAWVYYMLPHTWFFQLIL
ncbi:ABC transporter permease [Salirhabdus salicampi]|uniref:ABC transporter permease n=1 Tax=Salirhabdus salicampi TaxID=476102 RepID=UPI0020C29C97|nr:ABC transporter permease [Salirhabdus salicampi]MCP8615321.1 hypothetical protein [Salirhabdus salicampi]